MRPDACRTVMLDSGRCFTAVSVNKLGEVEQEWLCCVVAVEHLPDHRTDLLGHSERRNSDSRARERVSVRNAKTKITQRKPALPVGRIASLSNGRSPWVFLFCKNSMLVLTWSASIWPDVNAILLF